MNKISVLFVCLGNICRSPTAHGFFLKKLENSGLSNQVEVDSAGTSGWHIGSPPDSRSSQAAQKRGVDLSVLRGRQVCSEDFETYDYVLAMDDDNLDDLRRICPASYTGKLCLFLDYSSQNKYSEVPDPYHGGSKGFELVLDLIEDGCEGLLEVVKKQIETDA